MKRPPGVLSEAIGRWLCEHGHHKLVPWTNPDMVNVGHCERCGTIHRITR
jgi:hypothetical protein